MSNLRELRLVVLAWLIVVALGTTLLALGLGSSGQDLALNLGTEFVGAIATYALFELIIESRERRQAEEKVLEAKKAELTGQMGSAVSDVAVAAVEELQRRGWLTDGSLQGARLTHANLKGADLRGAHLEGAILAFASLKGADLAFAHLEEAGLGGAHLEGTDLAFAHLEGAGLRGAHLEGAILAFANLKGADLAFAHLEGAGLEGAHLEGAILAFAHLEGARVAAQQLSEARALGSVTLPDGKKLSRDEWEAEFEEWRKKQEEGENDD